MTNQEALDKQMCKVLVIKEGPRARAEMMLALKMANKCKVMETCRSNQKGGALNQGELIETTTRMIT